MYDFNRILNWKLLQGSHDFPGPEGGTCINEAAVVAAGFGYRKVKSSYDMPACFSIIISEYALKLNDLMPDDQRERLLPFVGRLSGTADSDEVEMERAFYLALQTVNVLSAVALDRSGWPCLAQECREATTLLGAFSVVSEARMKVSKSLSFRQPFLLLGSAHATVRHAVEVERQMVSERPFAWFGRGVLVAGSAASTAALYYWWDEAIALLEGVLAIGKQADPLDVAVMAERMDRARALAPA